MGMDMPPFFSSAWVSQFPHFKELNAGMLDLSQPKKYSFMECNYFQWKIRSFFLTCSAVKSFSEEINTLIKKTRKNGKQGLHFLCQMFNQYIAAAIDESDCWQMFTLNETILNKIKRLACGDSEKQVFRYTHETVHFYFRQLFQLNLNLLSPLYSMMFLSEPLMRKIYFQLTVYLLPLQTLHVFILQSHCDKIKTVKNPQNKL